MHDPRGVDDGDSAGIPLAQDLVLPHDRRLLHLKHLRELLQHVRLPPGFFRRVEPVPNREEHAAEGDDDSGLMLSNGAVAEEQKWTGTNGVGRDGDHSGDSRVLLVVQGVKNEGLA